jgi:hypothetical protein
MTEELIIKKLSALIKDGREIVSNISRHRFEYSNTEHINIKKFQLSAENALELRFGLTSRFYTEFMNTYNASSNQVKTSDFYTRQIQRQIGILGAALDALQLGLVDDLFYQKEILVFSDMLNQAFEFLNYKLDLAAAMYGRVVLESTIKEFAKKNNVNSDEKFDQIIINLRKMELIHKPLENSLRANYEIGTWAAHGDEKFNSLTSSQINEFLAFIRDKVLTLS